jgi:processive 1,2-diacylglycerol beta-glucosyltransferase
VPLRLFEGPDHEASQGRGLPRQRRTLLCDFHIHTNYSDGRLTLREVIDFYGRRKFDCICITDHVTDPRRPISRFRELLNLTIAPDQIGE